MILKVAAQLPILTELHLYRIKWMTQAHPRHSLCPTKEDRKSPCPKYQLPEAMPLFHCTQEAKFFATRVIVSSSVCFSGFEGSFLVPPKSSTSFSPSSWQSHTSGSVLKYKNHALQHWWPDVGSYTIFTLVPRQRCADIECFGKRLHRYSFLYFWVYGSTGLQS